MRNSLKQPQGNELLDFMLLYAKFYLASGGPTSRMEDSMMRVGSVYNKHAEVFNFGVAGTGFEHFYTLLHNMKEKVKITHIIIVAITDDFFRGYWHPIITDDIIGFCSENGIHSRCNPIPVAAIIPINAPEEDIREISRIKFLSRAFP